MKIIEVRDGFIRFEADESIYLSSFVQVFGLEKSYIAQISNLKTAGTVRIATAKILFIKIKDELFNYDNTEPTKDCELKPFTLDILRNSIFAKSPVILGKTYDNSGNIITDLSSFNRKMLISVNDKKMNNILVRNLSKQFENLGIKTVIIDTLGVIKAKKYTAGIDFKLPLNTSTLDFMYKSCMDDVTPDSKKTISEVFNDLSEYSKTVPFVSFGALKSIVEDMVDKQHVFKLLVLKNKLAKISKLGYFAAKYNEVENLNKLLESELSIIDLSKTDKLFQNCFLEHIYSLLPDSNIQVLLETSDNITKQNLKNIICDSNIPSTLITQPNYKYLNDIKSLFDNFIIEPSKENNLIFKVYNSFLESMEEGTYLMTGEGINYIPMVSKIQIIDDIIPMDSEEDYDENEVEEDIDSDENQISKEDNDSETVSPEDMEQTDNSDTTDEINTPTEYEPSENENDNTIAEVEEISEEEEFIEPENEQDTIIVPQPSQEEILANIEERSLEVIDSISENIDEQQNVVLFNSEDSEEQINNADDEEENGITSNVITNEEEDDDENENIIEPEYTEIIEQAGTEAIVEVENISSLDVSIIPESNQENDNSLIEPIEDNDLEESEDFEDLDITETPEDIDINNDNFNQEDELESLSDSLENQELELKQDEEELDIEEYQDLLLDDENSDNSLLKDNTDIQDYVEDNNEELLDMPLDNDSTDDIDLEDNLDITQSDEIVEFDPNDTDENDIIVDISDENENINIDEELEQQIMEDVDKVYTTIKEPEELDDFSDSDLDLIDELNSDEDAGVLEDYAGNLDDGILDQPTESIIPEKQKNKQGNNSEILEKRDSNTPIVPVYDADIPQEDLVISDPIQQGDSVTHAKYGNGIVEKMIKYGTKTLFSINFENIGRRLLDPTLTEIKKM